MGTKALHFTGQTKILRTADNKAANTCIEVISDDCCSGASIDVTFDNNINDCGMGIADCTLINGNTYTCDYSTKTDEYCRWLYSYGGITVVVTWYFAGEFLGKMNVYASVFDFTLYACFGGTDTIGITCEVLPVTIDSDYVVGNCGSGSPGVTQEGYDGQCTVNWT